MGRPCSRCGEKPGHALLRWGALAAVWAALEAEAVAGDRHHHTFSHATRRLFHTDTRVGSTAFSFVWGGLAIWYLKHILKDDPVLRSRRP